MEPPPPSKKRKVPRPPVPPSVPKGWDRCHAYMEKKGRFCRQEVLPTMALAGQFYCGNHRHLYASSTSSIMSRTTEPQEKGKIQEYGTIRKRILCPIDPTHHIYEDMLEKHIEKCPKTIEKRKQQEQSFYCQDCNCGGHGRLTNLSNKSNTEPYVPQLSTNQNTDTTVVEKAELEWAKQVAMTILETYHRLFPIPSFLLSKEIDITQISRNDICCNNNDSIPLLDLSLPEFDAGFQSAISDYRIKSGGQRHMHQQASMIGHLRRIGVIEGLNCMACATINPGTVSSSHKDHDEEHNSATPKVILEMGAGRGMTGLVIAGVSAMNVKVKTHLTMIERSASRSRAEKFLRKVKQFESSFPTTTNYMNLSHVQWNRIQCDLSHVNIHTALIPTIETICDSKNRRDETRPDVVVVAKHLCGVGTDLALKSIEPIRSSVTAVIMSTCCHGVCNWNDYVGRDYLLDALLNTGSDTPASTLAEFGQDEFDLLRLWSSGTVRDIDSLDATKDTGVSKELKPEGDDSDRDEVDDDVHPVTSIDQSSINNGDVSVVKVVEALNLKCGVQGLGRACQRLIDYGRAEYLRRVIFNHVDDDNGCSSNDCKVELLYYVPESITPQNALLIAHRSKLKLL